MRRKCGSIVSERCRQQHQRDSLGGTSVVREPEPIAEPRMHTDGNQLEGSTGFSRKWGRKHPVLVQSKIGCCHSCPFVSIRGSLNRLGRELPNEHEEPEAREKPITESKFSSRCLSLDGFSTELAAKRLEATFRLR